MFLTRENYKISVIGGLLLLGLTFATGMAIYSVMRQEIETTLGRGLYVALQSQTHLLENQIENAVFDTRALVTRPFIIQTMQQLNKHPGKSSKLHDLQKDIDSLLLTGFTAATVYDKEGNQLSQAGEFSQNKKKISLLNEFNNNYLLWDDQFILRMTEDVLDQNGFLVGSITTEKPLPKLTRSFGEIRTIGKTGEFILCAPPNDGKHEMDCLISQIDGVKYKQIAYVNENKFFPIHYALTGMNGVMTVKDYRHVSVIEAYAPLQATGLGMVLKLDEEELLKPITEQLKIIILFLSGLIFVEILLLNWFVRKLVKSERESRTSMEKAEQVSMVLSHKEIELHERLKEITCLYNIRRSIGTELSVENLCQKVFEHLIPAVQFPEIATAVIELDGWKFTSEKYSQDFIQHPLKSKIKVSEKPRDNWREERDPACTRRSEISVNGKICGQIRVFYPMDKPLLTWEEKELIDAIASDLVMWLERREVDQLLHERLKEITCLYEINREMKMELSVDKICQIIFDHLIPALQFPKIANAVIELDGKRFTSSNHDEEPANKLESKVDVSDKLCFGCYEQRDIIGSALQSKISVHGEDRGQISVLYPEDKPYLLPEEQELINAIANSLESWLERKRLEQALVFVAEEQLHTIGQELHDNLGQQMAGIGYQASALEKKILASENDSLSKVAASIATQAQLAVIQIKQIAQGLLPFEIEANGLKAALQTLASRIEKTYSITCIFTCKNEMTINNNNLSLNLYRISQEAANNAIRHGHAQHITISLVSEEKMLCLSICDDGHGLIDIGTKLEKTRGMGIKIMQFRAKQMGAELEFLPRAEGGLEVRLEINTDDLICQN